MSWFLSFGCRASLLPFPRLWELMLRTSLLSRCSRLNSAVRVTFEVGLLNFSNVLRVAGFRRLDHVGKGLGITYTCAVVGERNSSRTHSLSELVKSSHGRLSWAARQCRNREDLTYLCRKSQTPCNMVQTAARPAPLATPCTSCFVAGTGQRNQR